MRHLTEKFNERNQSALLAKNKTQISPGFIQLHLLPQRKNTFEGKRHYSGGALKSLKPYADFHEFHVDTRFCRSQVINRLKINQHQVTFIQIYLIEEYVRKLGDLVGVISIDEKAKCPLGLPALSRTTRQIMNVREPVVTADHTFSKGAKQSIVPTVLCGVNYNPLVRKYIEFVLILELKTSAQVPGKIGPVAITLRSTKYNDACPATRYIDIMEASSSSFFEKYFKQENGDPKEVLVIMCDGSVEGNQR